MKKLFRFFDLCRIIETVSHQNERLSRCYSRRQTDKKNRAWLSGGRTAPLRMEELEERQLLSVTSGEYEIETINVGFAATQTAMDAVAVTAAEIVSAVVATSPAAIPEAGANPGSTINVDIDGIDVLNLSSHPDSAYTIYLDFDGNTTSGTLWNVNFNDGKEIVTPRFTLDGNTEKTEFSEAEQKAIYEIWLRTAEDYMPFNVNVTTADPGTDVLSSSGAIRVCVGGSCYDWYAVEGEGGAGGVAYLTSFNYGSDTPCFVFPTNLALSSKSIAEAATHEVGHTLGLRHDGNSLISGQEEYYYGADGWAPIMGAGYYQPLTQWSRGEYAGATNTEDDLLIITTNNGFTYRADDFGNDAATAHSMNFTDRVFTTDGIIERNTDYDVFSFSTLGGDCSVTVDVMEEGGISNLDVLIEVYDASGSVVASADPRNTLSASLEFEATIGTYYVSVTGTGNGNFYSDYGSLGAYTITVEATAGEVFIVTTEEDVVDPDDGELSLREAIDRSSGGSVILFDSDLAGKTITLDAAKGQLEINESVTIDASALGAKGITVDAAGNGRVFYVLYGTDENPVTFINLTVTGGAYENGAGIYNAGILTLTDCVVTQNLADESGAGIYNTGKLSLTDSLVTYNTAAQNGGGVYNSGALTVNGSTWENNAVVSTGKSGGAIYNQNGRVAVYGSLFEGNTAPVGAAIANDYGVVAIENGAAADESGTETVMAARFVDNTAAGGAGAVYNNNGFLSIRGASITGNKTTGGFGGAVWSVAGGVSIVDSSITRGGAVSGGGVYVDGGTFSAVNTLIARSAAVENGGGLCLSGTVSAALTNVTVAGNAAASGGGIYALSDWSATNSVLALNVGGDVVTAGSAAAYYVLSPFTDWSNAADGLFYVYDPANPLFADAANADYTLADGSQAIDLGDNALAVDADGNPLEWDLAGKTRFSNNIVDLGAYEYQLVNAPSLVVTTNRDVINPTDGLISLREAILYAAEFGDALGTVITFDASLAGETITLDADLGAFSITNSVTIDASALLDAATGLPTVTIDAAAHKADPEVFGDADDFRRVFEILGSTGVIDVALIGLTITGGVFDSGLSETNGAGIYARGANLFVTDSAVTGNKAFGRNVSGAGIYLNGGVLTLKGTTVAENSASGRYSYGGGVFVSGDYNVEDSFITGNVSYAASGDYDAYAYGGGLYAEYGSAGFIANSEISANVAGFNTLVLTDEKPDYDEFIKTGTYYAYGGGLYILSLSLDVRNTTIAGNAASAAVTGYGGGLFLSNPQAEFEFYNSVIALNSAVTYGADLYNKIPNSDGSTAGILTAYQTLSGYQAWSNADDRLYYLYDESQLLFDVNPLFEGGILQNGETMNLALTQASQGVNRGDNDNLIYLDGSEIEKDILGNGRVYPTDGVVDLGAYEFQEDFVEAKRLVVTTTEDVIDASDGLISLREAVNYAQILLDAGEIEEAVITFDSTLADGTILYDAELGEIVIGASMTIDAMSLYVYNQEDPASSRPGITVDAGGMSRVFKISSSARTVAISGLTITGGNVASSEDGQGGAVFGEGESLTLTDSILTRNAVAGLNVAGGGLYAARNLNLINTQVTSNRAFGSVNASGGGVYVGGALTMIGGSVSENRLSGAENVFGGGIYSVGEAAISDNADVSNNTILAFAVTIDNTRPNIGSTITATVNPEESGASYQWYRGLTLDQMEKIGGATEAGYTVTESDVGYYLKVVATGSGDYAGFAVSAVTAKEVPPIQVILSLDPPLVGTTLSATLIPEEAEVTWQWYYGSDPDNIDTPIDGATESDYTITKENVGFYLKVVASGIDGTEYEGYAVYDQTAEEAALFEVTLSENAPELGGTISATLNPANAEALFQWYRGTDLRRMTPIAGATDADYVVTDADYGSYLRVVAVGNGAFTGFISSATTTAVVSSFSVTLSNAAPLLGDTITAAVSPAMADVIYQWYRGADAENMTAIAGADAKDYVVMADDYGLLLKVVVTGTGDYEGKTAEAATESVVERIAVSLSTQAPKVGETISTTVTPTAANPAYQWYRVDSTGNATPILGERSAEYTVVNQDIGFYIKAVVSGQDAYGGFQAEAATSSPVPAETIAVSVSGVLRVGQTVTARVDPSVATVTWQWSRVDSDGVETEIDGAADADYVITGFEIGCYLKATAVGTGIYLGQTASGISSETVETISVALSTDAPTVGTEIEALVHPADADVLYQWYRGTSVKSMTVISGAFSQSYTPTADDAGYYLRVVAVGSGEYTGYFASATSAQAVTETAESRLPRTTGGTGPAATGAVTGSFGSGGGIYGEANVTVTSSTVSGNKIVAVEKGAGGGISSEAAVRVTGGSVSSNELSGQELMGGGIYASTAEIVKTEVSRNRLSAEAEMDVAVACGGGIYVTGGVTLFRSAVLNNSAEALLVSEDGSAAMARGGGIFAEESASIAYYSVVSGNIVNVDGPGDYFYGEAFGGGVYTVSLELTQSSVSSNQTTAKIETDALVFGGGIFIMDSGTAALDAAEVNGNAVSGGQAQGGGLFLDFNSALTIAQGKGRSQISNNRLAGGDFAYGGGLSAFGSADISGTTLSGNTISAESGDALGGGIYIVRDLTLNTTKVTGNNASGKGTAGGVYARSGATVCNTLVAGNSAKDAAGLYLQSASTLVNVTIAANAASGRGGGLYIDGGQADIYNSIIATNGDSGGSPDVFFTGTANAYYTVSAFADWSNKPEEEGEGGDGDDDDEEAPLPTGATEQDDNGNLLYEGESLFAGGGADPYALAADSVAIDIGSNAYVVGNIDVIGNPRISNGTVDLGAYEFLEGIEAPSTVVTTAEDVVDATDGVISLREAISYADIGATITFIRDLDGATIALNGDFGSLFINKNLTIIAPGSSIITVSGGSSSVFVLSGTEDVAIDVTLERISVTSAPYYGISGQYVNLTHVFSDNDHRGSVSGNGYGGVSLSDSTYFSRYCDFTGNGNGNSSGGGIYAGNSELTLVEAHMDGNRAGIGGGLYVENSTVTMTNCTASNNTVSAGGGIAAFSSVIDAVNLNVSGNTISIDGGALGGALYLVDTVMTLDNPNTNDYFFIDNSMTSNQSYASGVIYAEDSTLDFTNLKMNGNTLTAYSSIYGGAIYVMGTKLTLNSAWLACEKTYTDGYHISKPGNILLSQESVADGAAVYAERGSDVTILDSYFRGNTAEGRSGSYGGAIYSRNGNLRIYNSEISENYAVQTASPGSYGGETIGGGIYFMSGDLTLVNCTIAFNSAKTLAGTQYSFGGGVFAAGTVSVSNSIIAMNYAMSGANLARPDLFETDESFDFGGNNIIDFNPYFIQSAVFDDFGNITNPTELGVYSTVTGESRAINTGNNDFALYPDGTPIQSDLSGSYRISPFDGFSVVDIGAHEYWGIPESKADPSNIVTTLLDVVDPDDGVWSLREAIYYAVDNTVIRFDPSLAGGTITLASQIFIDKPLTIEGGVEINGEIQRITLDAHYASRVVLQTEECTMSNFNFINGEMPFGAGIFATCLTLIDSSVLNCSASCNGGGIYGLGRLVLDHCVIDGSSANTTNYSCGGGLYMEHYNTKYGRTANEDGFLCDNGVLIVESSEFTNNRAGIIGHVIGGRTYAKGGAVYVANATSVMTNTRFDGNRVQNQDYVYGGALYLDVNAGKTVIMNSTFTNNSAALEQGTIFSLGGAIYNSASSELYLTNTLLSGNWGVDGGAIYSFDGTTTELRGCTVAGNSAVYGGGVYAFGRMTFINSIVALNKAATAGDDLYKGPGSLGVHYVSDIYAYNTLSSYSEWTNFQDPDAHFYLYDAAKPLFTQNPKFDAAANLKNAGTMVFTLAHGSQAVNLGDNDMVFYPDAAANLTGLAGAAIEFSLTGMTPCSAEIDRIIGQNVDLGAYEYSNYLDADKTFVSPGGVVVTTLDDVVDSSDGDISLREAIEYAGMKLEDGTTIGTTITFDPKLAENGGPLVITLDADFGTLVIRKSLTIDASALYDSDGAPRLIIDAAAAPEDSRRVLFISGMSKQEMIDAADADGLLPDDGAAALYVAVRLIGLGVTGGYLTDAAENLYGAGIFAHYANLTMTDCSVYGNTAETGGRVYGAGLWAEYGQNLTLTDCDITGNTARGRFAVGSGAGAAFYQTVKVSDSFITGNTADAVVGAYGAGLGLNGGVVDITNSAVTLNAADADVYSIGGGLFVTGTLTLTCDTVAGNTAASKASQSGGLWTTGMLYVDNTILTNNFAVADANLYGKIIGGGHNIIDASNDAVLFVRAAEFDVKYDAEGNLLKGKGGILNPETADFNLAKDSPAIDAGDNAAAVYPDGSAIEYDITGRNRIFHGTIDIGAYEYNRLQLVVTTLKDGIDPTDGLLSLREAIEWAGTVIATGEQYETVITFDSSLQNGTITVSGTNGAFRISKDLTIDASSLFDAENGLTGITINGDGTADLSRRVFEIAAEAGESIDVELIGLTVTGGYVAGGLNDAAGGGIYAKNVDLTLTDVVLTGNAVTSRAKARGGALYLTNAALTVVRGRMTGNSASGGTGSFGGGLYIHSDAADVVIRDAFLTSNSARTDLGAASGGAIYTASAGRLSVTNSQLTDNSATDGGAVASFAAADIRLVNATVAGNRANYGGGVYAFGTVTFDNTIAAANRSAVDGDDIYRGGGTLDYYLKSTYIARRTLSGYDAWDPSDESVHFVYDPDQPLFAVSETGLYFLAENSQAHNRGDNRLAVYADGTAIRTDIVGNPRIADDLIDLGAFEYPDYGLSIVVTTAEDVVDADDGETSLREAVQWAEEQSFTGRILFNPSLFGKVIALNSELTVSASTVIDAMSLYDFAHDAPGITISAGGNGRVLKILGSVNNPIDVTLRGVTITGGFLTAETGSAFGAGLYSSGAHVTLTDCVVTNNRAEHGDAPSDLYACGGGIYSTNGSLTLISSEIRANSAADSGGGIYASESVRVIDSVIADNEVNGSYSTGGGLYFSIGELTISGSTIRNNRAVSDDFAKGGGLYLDAGTVVIRDGTRIVGNTATAGGGIYSFYNDQILIQRSEISGNTAGSAPAGTENAYGGGIYSWGDSLSIEDSLIAENAALGTKTHGGGLYITYDQSVSLVNSAILDNSAGGTENAYGGGFYVYYAEINAVNSTIAGNEAKEGGGVFAYGLSSGKQTSATFKNSIIALNRAETEGTQDLGRGNAHYVVINASYTLSSFSDWTAAESVSLYDAGRPLFRDAENGDYSLREKSQAVDIGKNDDAVYPDGSAIEFDLSGKGRIVNSIVDLGAYEYDYFIAAPSDAAFTDYDSAAMTVVLNWTDNSDNETGFRIESSTDGGGTWNDLAVVDANQTSFVCGPIDPALIYSLRVRAENEYGSSDWALATFNPNSVLFAPENVASASAGTNRVTVTWDAAERATGYELAYSTDQTSWETIPVSDTSFTVTGLTYGSTVYYRVRAVNEITTSDWSEAVGAVVCPMDVNGDGRINAGDRTMISSAWLSREGSANWDPRCDLNGDGRINAADRNFISMNWMKVSTSSDLVFPPENGPIAETIRPTAEAVAAFAQMSGAAPFEAVTAFAPMSSAAPFEAVAAFAPISGAAPPEAVTVFAPVGDAAPFEAVTVSTAAGLPFVIDGNHVGGQRMNLVFGPAVSKESSMRIPAAAACDRVIEENFPILEEDEEFDFVNFETSERYHSADGDSDSHLIDWRDDLSEVIR